MSDISKAPTGWENVYCVKARKNIKTTMKFPIAKKGESGQIVRWIAANVLVVAFESGSWSVSIDDVDPSA